MAKKPHKKIQAQMYYKPYVVSRCLQKVLTLFSLTLVLPMSSTAQDTTLQRLMAAKDDTVKVKNLLDYGRDLLNVDNAKAEPFFTAAIQISERLQYHEGVGRGWTANAYISAQKGAYRKAIDKYTNAVV